MLEETPEDLVIVSSEEAGAASAASTSNVSSSSGFATLLGPVLPPPPMVGVTLVQQQQQQQQQKQQQKQQQQQQQPQVQQPQQQQQQQPVAQSSSSSSSSGWGSWLSASTTAFVSKAMEKTRGGVESVIGSLDPAGMQALLLTGGDCRVALAVDSKTDESAARLSIQRSFGRAVVGAVTDAPTGLAPTPLGFSSLRLASQQRLRALVERVRATAAAEHWGDSAEQQRLPLAVSVCRGVVEPTPDHFCQVYCVCLLEPRPSAAVADDGDESKEEEEELCAYSATLPVSQAQLDRLRSSTPDDYPLKWSGFAVELDDMASATEQQQLVIKQTLQQAVSVAIAAWQQRDGR